MSLFNRITTWAAGQILKSADLNGELNNLVNGLNNLDSATTAWTNIKTGILNVTGTSITLNSVLTTNAAGYILGTIVQTVQNVDTTSVTSVGTAYTSTNLTATITPKATTHKIRISVTGRCANLNAAATTFVSIFAGAADLSSGGTGFTGSDSTTTPLNFESGTTIVYLHSPSSVSAITYTVKIKSAGVSAASTWNSALGNCVLLLEELAQ